MNQTRPFISNSLIALLTSGLVVPPTSQAEPANVYVQTVDESAVAGSIVSFSLNHGLVLHDAIDGNRHIPTADLVNLSTHYTTATPSTGAVTVELMDGGRIIGIPGRFAGDRVTVTTLPLGNVAIPLEMVSVWLNPRAVDRPSDVEALVNAEAADQDRLLLSNGDRVAGVIHEIDRQAVSLETPVGITRIAQEKVVASVVVGAWPTRALGLRAAVRFVDGSIVLTDAVEWSDDGLKVRVPDGTMQRVQPASVRRVVVIGGRWQRLCDLVPDQVRQTPMFTIPWSLEIDRNTLGRPLRVDGKSFEHGIGVHSGSALSYRLNESYIEFVTSFGLDDESGPLADVAVDIRVDGERRHYRETVRKNEFVESIRIDVSKAQRLELIVEFGRLGGIQDRFDWIEPVLIRSDSSIEGRR